MKKLFVLASLLTSLATVAQDKDALSSKELPISSFSQLEAGGIFELYLTQDNTESVRVEAKAQDLDLVKVRNEGQKLFIEMKEKDLKLNRKDFKMKVYVSFKNLDALNLHTIGKVTSTELLKFTNLDLNIHTVGNVKLQLDAAKLNMKNNSVGNVELSGEAREATIDNNSVGNVRASDLKIETLDIENNGVGNAEVNVSKSLKVKNSMLGKVRNSGSATARSMNRVRV